jgi:hypothetical protein
MKTLSRLLLAAALAVSPALLATAALADETFSHTNQNDLVLQAVASLREGRYDDFRGLLEDSALSQYGSDDRLRELRARLEQAAGGAPTSSLNTRMELEGSLGPDTHILISNRTYTVDLLRDPSHADSIWSVSVHCIGASVLDSFGMTDKCCRITAISLNHARPRPPGAADTQSLAGVQGSSFGKGTLREEAASLNTPPSGGFDAAGARVVEQH